MSTVGKTVTCRAAVVHEANGPFVIETVEVSPPSAGEVRVKMSSAGICHSDLHFLEGIVKNYPFPTVLGHEGAGIVESVGADVENVAVGDTVVLLFEGYCGKCDLCLCPKVNQCQKQPRNGWQIDGTSRITCNGKALSQLTALGAFSEYTVTAEMNVVKVNPEAPVNRLCLAGCCIPTGYGAAVKCAQVTPGATCAIWGLGGVGMNVVIGCKDCKASKIIGIDINPEKFTLAKELGCTDVLNPKEQSKTVPEVLAEMTNGGADFCFVSVGNVSVMEEAFQSSHPLWGQTIIIGLSDMECKMKAGVWDLLLGRVLRGTLYGSYKAKLIVPQLVDKIVNEEIPLNKLITHVLPLDEINEGFELMKKGEPVRAVIDFDLKKN